jgi:hypothetical protein
MSVRANDKCKPQARWLKALADQAGLKDGRAANLAECVALVATGVSTRYG